jgi:hypothetical protein
MEFDITIYELNMGTGFVSFHSRFSYPAHLDSCKEWGIGLSVKGG